MVEHTQIIRRLLPTNCLSVLHGSRPPPLILGGDLKMSDQDNWGGGPEQKIKFGGELNLRGDLKL